MRRLPAVYGRPATRRKAPTMTTICAWHPGFNPRDPANRGASHTCCPACEARLMAQMDALEAQAAPRAAIVHRLPLPLGAPTPASRAILATMRQEYVDPDPRD